MDTKNINKNNVNIIREQIYKKISDNPYYATKNTSVKVLTDYDTFPYPRYWRGISESYNPIVSEREAGWRPRMDSCYKIKPFIEEVSPPNICFQSSCSTIYPCSTEFSKMHLEKNTAINNCSIQYR